jgi:hypothetical protein
VVNFRKGSENLKKLVDRYQGSWVESQNFEQLKTFIANIPIEPLAMVDFEFKKQKKIEN